MLRFRFLSTALAAAAAANIPNRTNTQAALVIDNSKQGDVVVVTNSGGPVLEPWDGFGDWQVPWAQWVQGNR